jgi:proline iminopeptidase
LEKVVTPDKYTNEELMLDVGDVHTLYVHDWGKKEAETPILFLHGGPGGGCNDGHKGYFNPEKHRVIFFDQRGSGRSLPGGSIEHNTTAELIGDMTKVLDKLDVKQVILCGRSWGSTLALVYAIQNTDTVSAIVTGGVWLGNKAEAALEERTNVSQLFYPENWVGIDSSQDMLSLWKSVLSDDEETSKRAAYNLAQLLSAQLRLDDRGKAPDFETFDPSSLRIEAHYKTNDWFLGESYILDNAPKLTMPVWIVQGRYDMVCLPKFAYELHQKLPGSQLIWTQAGHSGGDRENWLATKTVLEAL